MKIKTSKETLQKTVQESREAKEKSIQNMNKEKFPVGFGKLKIVGVEHTSFTFKDKKTGEDRTVQKIIVQFNTGLEKSEGKYYDFRMDFPFFTYIDKETGDFKCIAFEQLYSFISDAFGKEIQFKNSEAEIPEIAETIAKALNHFKEKATPFYGIVVHKENVYKDKLILSPEIFMSSVVSMTGDIKKIEEIDKKMSNKVWKLNDAEKKKLLAKKRNQSASMPNQNEDGVPAGVENYSANMSSFPEDDDDDLPF